MLIKHFKYVAYAIFLTAFSVAGAETSVDFFRAINVDDAGTVRRLLERGFDPNTISEKGQVGLYLAFRDESPKAAAALLAHPQTRIDAINKADETPLMMAALRGQLDGVRQLLDRGAAVNRPGWTPLHYAASGPEPRVVGLLLDRGAQLEALSPNRTTPLMMAARYGPEDAVDLLLARGASLSARNDAGLGPVDFAVLAGRESLAARLKATSR
ncbi:MAG: ankyrin repeat domain-containing protein [Betaproteobacteria bacterium]|nr:ankyrin repeat domain-containing protein [Betaproteobacteria bacterium]